MVKSLGEERPSIQVLERATGYVVTENGKIAGVFKATYKRHDTLNLLAALKVTTSQIRTSKTKLKRREELLEFMD